MFAGADYFVGGDVEEAADDPPIKPAEPAIEKVVVKMGNVFLKAEGENGFYAGRAAVLRSHRLKELLVLTEARRVGSDKNPVEVVVPDVQQDILVKIMEHCERHAGAHKKPEANPEDDDRLMVDGLELEDLLRLTGASHRLGIQPLLNLCAQRVADALLEVCSGSPGERAGVPMDAYMRQDPTDALSDEDKDAAPLEFIFTLPDSPPAPLTSPESAPASPTPRTTTYGRYTGALALPTRPGEAAAAEVAAGAHGAAGTGSAGASGAPRGIGAAGKEQLVSLLGGEAPLLACLVKLDAQALRSLKPLGKRWRRRARTALCSGDWAETVRATAVLDLGSTRHWLPSERCTAARFISDGRFAGLQTLRADGFEAELPSLLRAESIASAGLLRSLVVNPSAESVGVDPDALMAQSEFCALLALWVIGSSHILREADFSALTYSGLLPLRNALAPAVELASRRHLISLTVHKSALPVRDLVGMAPPPPPHGSTAPVRSAPTDTVDLKWQRLGALDATLIAALLRANRVITRLDLSWNCELTTAGSTAAVDLAEAISASRALKEVNLSETSLGDRCAPSLCRTIMSSPALTRLNLKSCGLTAESRDALTQANASRTAKLKAGEVPLELVL